MRLALWTVLWTALVALSAAPALAQGAPAGNGERDREADVQIVDCSQVINVIQGQYGDATAIGRRAVAVIANEQGVTVNQVNACLGNVGDEETTDEETTDEETTDEETTEETTDEETTVVRGETVIVPDKLSDTTLPETGGPGGYVLAAGCALLGVGLILNRIAR